MRRKLRAVTEENAKLKRLLADTMLGPVRANWLEQGRAPT